MKVEVLNIQGEKTGRAVELPDSVFGIEPNEHAVYLAVKQYLAHQRQGTHKAKERNEVAGSTRKLKRQKGTGTARAGDIKSPVFRGGGRIFGPKPHKYTVRLNKKVKTLAKKSVLSDKATKEGGLFVIERPAFDAPKTKDFINVLNSLSVAGKKTLLVTGEYDKNLYLSGRNVPHSNIMNVKDINTYMVLNANSVIFTEDAVGQLSTLFA